VGLYNSSDRVYGSKDCVRSPQAQTTAEQYERTGKKGSLFFSCFFSLLSLRSFRVCSLHAQEGPLTALVLFLRTEQPVRCKGCIIVRIIRGGGEGEKSLFLFSLVRSARCAKTQTTTAVSMLVCIRVFLFFFFFLILKKKKKRN
jgi:hypothetical protein